MTYSALAVISEMATSNLRPAATCESGFYWRSLDGRMYWVTSK
jgi:hypothetical protein